MTLTHEERAKRREQIAKDIKSGMDPHEVALKYKLSASYIYTFLRPGELKKSNPRRSPEFMCILAEIINTETAFTDIADAYKVTTQYVSHCSKLMEKAGIKFPHRPHGTRKAT